MATHTPLIKGPLIKGVGVKKHYKTRGFGQSTPLIEPSIKGVNFHPLN